MRTVIWFIYFWLYQIFALPTFLKINRIFKEGDIKRAKALADKQAQKWAVSLVKLAGGRVQVKGQEHVPTEGPVVFVSNHQSNFDIPLLLGYVKGGKGFVAKIETKKMPIVGKWMAFLQCVFIERKDPRAALKSIKEGIEIIKAGNSMVIFPEGTRSATGELAEFKPGSFKLALKSKAPIVPVTIKGSIDMMRKGEKTIKPADVKIILSKPIDTTVYASNESYLVREEVFKVIEANLKS